MRSYVTLYVPSKYTNVRIEAGIAMARIAGGVTVTQAYGLWELEPDQPLVSDQVELLKSFVNDADLTELIAEVGIYTNALHEAGEQSVAIEINGELIFE